MAGRAPAERVLPERAHDNLKIGDLPQYNRDDKKITFGAWKMQIKRMLAASNIPAERQSSFILAALTGGSLTEILAFFGPDGPAADLAPAALWGFLTNIFTQVELTPDRDNRFARVKQENFRHYCSFSGAVQLRNRELLSSAGRKLPQNCVNQFYLRDSSNQVRDGKGFEGESRFGFLPADGISQVV